MEAVATRGRRGELRTAVDRLGGLRAFAGLACLCLVLQLGLQNLYIACTYADHVPRASTWIAAVHMGALAVGLGVVLAAARRVGPTWLRWATGGVLLVGLVLLGAFSFVAPAYSFAFALVLAAVAGVLVAGLLSLWTVALHRVPLYGLLALLLGANGLALVAVGAFFSWTGLVVWFDFGDSVQEWALKALVALAFVGAWRLCPQEADRGPVYRGRGEFAGAYGNLLLAQGRRLAGVVAFAFCAALHWEVNAMRSGNGFDLHWSLFGHEIAATAMAFYYLVMAVAVVAVGLALLSLCAGRWHVRMLFTALFYLIGGAFFVPGLLGVSIVSASGLMVVGMFLYLLCAFALVVCDRDAAPVPLAGVAGLFFLLVVVGLGAGLLVSWAVAPAVHLSQTFLIAFTALSLFFVMTAPNLLVKASTPSLAPAPDDGRDTLAARCRALAVECHLSPRETEVMELAARGYSAPAVASTLFITESTVKVHMRHIYEKLGIHGKQELIQLVRG